ncbi:MAG: hypothetical protein AB8H80_00915 [Planctomycetota bacterium]
MLQTARIPAGRTRSAHPARTAWAAAAAALLLTGCGPTSEYHDYSTPERAAKSFVEAGRIGDVGTMRRSVVAAERKMELSCDYKDLGAYSISLDRLVDDSAVVLLQAGPKESPLACRLESDGWKVSLRETLTVMQQSVDAKPAAPR